MIEIQVCTIACADNVRSVEAGETDLDRLKPAVILRSEAGSTRVHRVRLRNGATVAPYISGRTFGVRVFVDESEIESTC